MPNLMETSAEEISETVKLLTIANQNNVFREALTCERAAMAAATFGVKGKVVLTRGIHSLGHEFTQKALTAVAAFDDFTEENDPYGECDFGSVQVDETKVFWKIDLYNNSLDGGSEEPENPTQTHRVLTILLPSEY